MKKLLTLLLFSRILGQQLPQPAILGEDLIVPKLKISNFVEVTADIKDEKVLEK